jgi:predicted PurR-regulated permease PerM
MPESPPSSLRDFARRVLVVLALVALALFLWRVRDMLLLGFAAVLAAILLRALADPIARRSGAAPALALALAVLLVLALLGGVLWLFGAQVGGQLQELSQRLPHAWQALQAYLQRSELGALLLSAARQAGPSLGAVAAQLTHVTALASGALVGGLLVAFGDVYLAGDPQLYRDGVLKLFPQGARDEVAGMLGAAARALRLWLLGQLAVMVAVGLLIGLGLWLVGLPTPLALGLLSGLAEFVPYVGPVLAAVPGVLLGLSAGPAMGLYALVVYVVVLQVEGNVIVPLVSREVLALPPALVLFAVMAAGLVLGPLGLLLAAPLTVLAVVAVSRLYVRDTLDTPVQVPGEHGAASR